MGTAVLVVVLVVVAILVVGAAMNSVSKSGQKMRGHSRCAFCKARLKSVNGQYALACRKCGRTQPWADEVAKRRKRR